MSAFVRSGLALLAACSLATAVAGAASAEPRHHHRQVASGERSLTISPHPRVGAIYRQGNDIIAPGGFSAHGYGYPTATAEDKKQAYNTYLRNVSRGYGYEVGGADGIAGLNDDEPGYTNPAYGNSFNAYVGYNGVPTNLAFGPGFAMRPLTGHDPLDDDDAPGPSPKDLGYAEQPDD